MNEKNILLDVTTLLRWDRPPVGIIRTQLEFVSFILHNDATAKYCYFTPTRDDLKEISRDAVQQIVEKLSNASYDKSHEIPKRLSPSNGYIRVIRKTITIYRNEGMKALLIKICHKICPLKVKSLMKKIYARYFSSFQTIKTLQDGCESFLFAPEIDQAKKAEYPFLTRNTTLVSIGLDWDYSNYPMLYWLKQKIGFSFVGAFYDAIPILFPHLVQSSYFSQRFFAHFYSHIHLADKIFCISNYSQSQLRQLCEQHHIKVKPQIETLYLGDSLISPKSNFSNNKRGHSGDYIVYVSTIEARKNHILLLDVWEKLAKTSKDPIPHLVLVGMMGWGVDELKKRYEKSSLLKKVVHFYNNVNDDELITLYKKSLFTVFPSFVEGWGLGAVESMLYGKVCIISDCPALIEATQGLMPSIDPTNVDAWLDEIQHLLTDEAYHKSLQERIKTQFKPRSWQDFGKEFKKFASIPL